MTIEYFFTDDGQFDYETIYNPNSVEQMYGYKAVGWNTDFSMTGWWQGQNVFALTTDSPLYDPNNGRPDAHSQAIQLQYTWESGDEMPWLWTNRGQDYTFTIEGDLSVPVSWGDNLQQGLMLTRFGDVSSGQKLWVQFRMFDNLYPGRPIDIFSDPHTNYEDIVVNIDIVKDSYNQFVSFANSAEIETDAFSDVRHFEANMSRQQFTDLLIHAEQTLGIDIQNESGYWSLVQAGFSPEMASGFPQWGIGDTGAMQAAMDNISVWGE
jgi:hypothetical protein